MTEKMKNSEGNKENSYRSFKEFLNGLEDLFVGLTEGNPRARQLLLEKLGDLDLSRVSLYRPPNIDYDTYLKNREFIWHEFLFKVAEGQVLYDPSQGTLVSSFLYSVFINLWHDWGRHRDKKPVSETGLGASIDDLFSASNPPSEVSFRLQKEAQKKFEMMLNLRHRVIFKLWKPYLFAWHFEPSEMQFLESKGWEMEDLIQNLHEEMDLAARKDKDYISPAVIAEWLDLKRNTVDQNLSRIRRKLDWPSDISKIIE